MSQPGGFDFLGYHFEREGKRWPREKSMTGIKQKVPGLTHRTCGVGLNELIASELNPVLRGWYGYFWRSNRWTFSGLDAMCAGACAESRANAKADAVEVEAVTISAGPTVTSPTQIAQPGATLGRGTHSPFTGYSPTGEPDAVIQPVRFGGRGGFYPRPYPYLRLRCRVGKSSGDRFRQMPRGLQRGSLLWSTRVVGSNKGRGL